MSKYAFLIKICKHMQNNISSFDLKLLESQRYVGYSILTSTEKNMRKLKIWNSNDHQN